MARILDAVRDYGPRLVLGKTVELDELAEWMSSRTDLNQSQVLMVLAEINEAIRHFGRRGVPVRFPAVGRFGPSIRRDGRIRLRYRPDVALRRDLDGVRGYRGEIRNLANIGLDDAAYKALWDADHPDDPLVLCWRFDRGKAIASAPPRSFGSRTIRSSGRRVVRTT